MLKALDATQQRALMEARTAYVPTRFPLPPVYPLATLLAATPAATLPRCGPCRRCVCAVVVACTSHTT